MELALSRNDDMVTVHSGRPMISGQDAAQRGLYDLHVGRSGRLWLVTTARPVDDWVYVSDPNPRSQGFAGAELEFPIPSQNCVVRLRGAWKSGASSLFEDTGLDYRDQFLTQGVVAKHVQHKWPRAFYTGLLHYDEGPVVGRYSRVKSKAQSLADELGERVFFSFQYATGGLSGSCDPARSP